MKGEKINENRLINALLPENEVYCLTLDGIELIEPQNINVTKVGEKAYGLSSVPCKWSLPYVVLDKDIYELFKTNCLRGQLLDTIIDNLFDIFVKIGIVNYSNSLIVRSSAIKEGIFNRGEYHSVFGPVNDIKKIILECFKLHNDDKSIGSNDICFIIQPYIELNVEKGHLSNERRFSKDKRDWLCTIEKLKGEEELTINIREWRNITNLKNYIGKELICHNINQRKAALEIVAKWAYEKRARVHFEWLWNGERLLIVQADGETENRDEGKNPLLANTSYRESELFKLRCLKDLSVLSCSEKYGKLNNVLLYEKLGISTQKLFVLNDMNVIENISRGDFSEALSEDLDVLTKNVLIVRMDIPNDEDQTQRQLLPRTECQSDIISVKQWLKEQSIIYLKKYSKFAFIFHNYIPSISSAFVYVEPKNSIVIIESLWGLPEGLYYNSHDKYYVDTLQEDLMKINTKKIEIRKNISYKPYFIAPDASGKWVRQNTLIPHDYSDSIVNDEWIKDIAVKSRTIAEKLEKKLSVMWFVGVPKAISPSQVIPWFHEEYEYNLRENNFGFKVKTAFDKTVTIQSYEDIKMIKANIRKGKEILFLKIQPIEDQMLRDKNVINEIAQLCKEIDATIILEGGQLSHVYYQLSKKEVNIHSINPFRLSHIKNVGIEYNKLVRDGIVNKIKEGGEYVDYAELEDNIFDVELRKKLVEEAFEVLDAKSSQEIAEELADVSQVVISLANLLNVPLELIETIRKNKLNKIGGFEKGLVLRKTESFRYDDKQLNLSELLPEVKNKLSSLKQEVKRNIDNREDDKINLTLLNLKIPIVLDEWKTDFRDVRKIYLNNEQIDVRITGRRKKGTLDLSVEMISRKSNQISIFDFDK